MTESVVELQPHQERVITERDELNERMSKLKDFIGSKDFFTLDFIERSSLEQQLRIMGWYRDVLNQRIRRFAL